jgi:hypothetical protein
MRLTPAEQRELAAILYDAIPRDIRDERRRVRLSVKGLAWRDEFHPWKWHLTEQGQAIVVGGAK